MGKLAVMSQQTPEDIALKHLQGSYAISYIGGDFRVVDRRVINGFLTAQRVEEIYFITKRDAELMMSRDIEALPIAVKYPKDLISTFWKMPSTHVYKNMGFHPKKKNNDFLNLWIPPTVKPVDGCWKIINDFLIDVICSGDKKLYTYLVEYLAHAIQRPEEKSIAS